MNWLWTSFTLLPIWAFVLWGAYFIYFVCRAYEIWHETSDEGLWKGYKNVFLGYRQRTLRLHHLIRMVFDIPPAILGLLFPVIRKIFTLKLYEFKDKGEK